MSVIDDDGYECKWVSVKDGLPEQDVDCWVYNTDEGEVSLTIDFYDGECWGLARCMDPGEFYPPTHWWRIDEPPCRPTPDDRPAAPPAPPTHGH